MTADEALAALRAQVDPQKAAEMAAYHKVDRPYLGVANPVIDNLAKGWRAGMTLDDRLSLASALWETNIHEARVAAAKLLTQARIRPDDEGAWRLIASWVPDFDAWAIADHVSVAGQKRLVWDPTRLDEVEGWTTSEHMWTRRAALVMTLPWTRDRNPKPEDLSRRERILDWAAGYVDDPDWFIQKAVAWWLRDLSKRDPERVRTFLDAHGARMKAFARKEAGRLLA
jgi:3-methyladenine DNA glycosylase AlkD